MLVYKVDILQMLKEKGYNSGVIRRENLLNQSILQYLREGKMVGITAIDKLCGLLDCQPGDLLEFVPEKRE